MALEIYNTLSRKKEEFKPINAGKVGIYVCGPTVYNHCHLGHARGYVSMDAIRRYFEYLGFEVRHIMNYTDVGHLVDDGEIGEDKIEKEAKKEKLDPMAIADKYIKSCEEDFAALNIKTAHFNPRPTEYIAQIIKFVEGLIKKDFAYVVNGSVYFSVEKFIDYGKLSNRKIEDLQSGARVEINTEKKNPLDFAVWIKAPKEHLLKWESPWGAGYPGWHIECSVMSADLFGQTTFDVHGGGNENAFPHNENEIAQSEAYLGEKMANYWIHWNMVNVNGTKMSKSLGNFTTIKDALQKYNPMIIRLWILSAHYRSPIDFSEKAIQQAKVNFETINNFYLRLLNYKPTLEEKIANFSVENYKKEFETAMNDDFNTPEALATILKMANEGNRLMDENLLGNPAESKKMLETMSKVFGFILGTEKIPDEVEKIANERKTARENKDFSKSDELRDKILEIGYVIEDLKDNEFILKKK